MWKINQLLQKEYATECQNGKCKQKATHYWLTWDNRAYCQQWVLDKTRRCCVKKYQSPISMLTVVKEASLLAININKQIEILALDREALDELDRFFDEVKQCQEEAITSVSQNQYDMFDHIKNKTQWKLQCFKGSYAFSAFQTKFMEAFCLREENDLMKTIEEEILAKIYDQKSLQVYDEMHILANENTNNEIKRYIEDYENSETLIQKINVLSFNKIKNLQQMFESTVSENSKLNKNIERNCQNRIEKLTEDNNIRECELKTKIEKLKSDLEQANKKVSDLKNQLSQKHNTDTQFTKLTERIIELESELKLNKEQFEELYKNLQISKRSRFVQAQIEKKFDNYTLKQSLDQLKEENSDLISKISSLSKSKMDLELENSQLVSKYSELQIQLQSQENSVYALNHQIIELKRNFDSSINTIENLNAQVARDNFQRKSLEDQLDNLNYDPHSYLVTAENLKTQNKLLSFCTLSITKNDNDILHYLVESSLNIQLQSLKKLLIDWKLFEDIERRNDFDIKLPNTKSLKTLSIYNLNEFKIYQSKRVIFKLLGYTKAATNFIRLINWRIGKKYLTGFLTNSRSWSQVKLQNWFIDYRSKNDVSFNKDVTYKVNELILYSTSASHDDNQIDISYTINFYYDILNEISKCGLKDSLKILRINHSTPNFSFKTLKSELKSKMKELGLSHIKLESWEQTD